MGVALRRQYAFVAAFGGLLGACGCILLLAGVSVSAMGGRSDRSLALVRMAERQPEITLVVEARDSTGLAAFEATIAYAANVVSPTQVTAGSFLPPDSHLLPVDTHVPGRLVVGAYSTGGQTSAGSGLLTSIRFVRRGAGSADFSLLPDASGLFGLHGQPVPGRLSLRTEGRAYLPRIERQGD